MDRGAPYGRHRLVAPPPRCARSNLRLISILTGEYGGPLSRIVAECEEALGISSGKNGSSRECFPRREVRLSDSCPRTDPCGQALSQPPRIVQRKCWRGCAVVTRACLSES